VTPLLEVSRLTKEFTRKRGLFGEASTIRAVDEVSFAIPNLARRGQSVRFSGTARGEVIEGVVALPGGEAPWRATRTSAR